MAITRIYAQLNCTDMDRSRAWFETLFGRGPDAAPMDGLNEWHHGESAGFQLFRNKTDAGHGSMTLIVSDLAAEIDRLRAAGIATGETRSGDVATILEMTDPDGNAVILAEPKP